MRHALILLIAVAVTFGKPRPLKDRPKLFLGRPWDKYGMLGPLRKPSVSSLRDSYFQQPVDHFNSSDTRTYGQRYFVSDTTYKPGGPVFLQLSGESEADQSWIEVGSTVEMYAPKFGALNIMLEHRYYGESRPTQDLKTENLKYLSSRQAIADAANFIRNYEKIDPRVKGAKWVAFGGSYAGALAAFIRTRYPDLIYAAVATSGPVQADVDNTGYFTVVGQSIVTLGGQECADNIKKANDQLTALVKDPSKWNIISNNITCGTFNGNNKLDVDTMYWGLAVGWASTIQYFTGSGLDLCDTMNDQTIGTELQRYLQLYGQCIDNSYKDYIADLFDTSYDEGMMRQWTYQTCTEFGYYQSTDNPKQPFEGFPVNFFTQVCKDVFGPQFTPEFIQQSIDDTNKYYGGWNAKTDRVVYPNGSIDPWHALGITNSTNLPDDSIAIYINGTSHCADMMPPSSDDPPSLTKARQEILGFLEKHL